MHLMLGQLGTRWGLFFVGQDAIRAAGITHLNEVLDHFLQQICVMHVMLGELGTRWGLFFVGQNAIRATGITHLNEVLAQFAQEIPHMAALRTP